MLLNDLKQQLDGLAVTSLAFYFSGTLADSY